MTRSPASPLFRPLLFVAVLALGTLLAACSDDEASDTTDTGGTDSGADTGADAASDVPAGSWNATLYRVTDLFIDQPASLGPLIGELVNRDIRNGLLNILIETGQFGASSGDTTFEIRGGAGETEDDGATFALVNDVDWVPASVEANADFMNTELLTLDFPVILQLPPACNGQACPDNRCESNDNCDSPYTCDLEGDGQCVHNIVLPLKEIQITGAFGTDDDGDPVLSLATLDGAILKEDADQITVGLPGSDPISLTSLLNEDNMNYPDRDNPTGWALSALINAEAVTAAE